MKKFICSIVLSLLAFAALFSISRATDCDLRTAYITVKYRINKGDGFLVAFATNNSPQKLDVYIRAVSPDGSQKTSWSETTLKPGQTDGGELGGLWWDGKKYNHVQYLAVNHGCDANSILSSMGNDSKSTIKSSHDNASRKSKTTRVVCFTTRKNSEDCTDSLYIIFKNESSETYDVYFIPLNSKNLPLYQDQRYEKGFKLVLGPGKTLTGDTTPGLRYCDANKVKFYVAIHGYKNVPGVRSWNRYSSSK